MNIEKFTKQEIALRQIETALALYFSRGDLFSVITLAGAAEEILGQLLEQQKSSEGVRGKFASLFGILRPARRKRDPEEEFTGSETGSFLHLDVQREARFLLGRAIEDYVALTSAPTQAMLKFLSEAPAP
jgi:hypothetical protein